MADEGSYSRFKAATALIFGLPWIGDPKVAYKKEKETY
jgi:hypothetical protein